MPFDPEKHHRHSVRLDGYDYAQDGAYFVTICTHRRICLFGDVIGDNVRLNDYGAIVQDEWLQTATIRPNIILDEFVIMPNHVHGIIILSGDSIGTTRRVAPTTARAHQIRHRVHLAQSSASSNLLRPNV